MMLMKWRNNMASKNKIFIKSQQKFKSDKLHKKWRFPFTIYSVNVIKSAVSFISIPFIFLCSDKYGISTVKVNQIALSIMAIKKCKYLIVGKHFHMKHLKKWQMKMTKLLGKQYLENRSNIKMTNFDMINKKIIKKHDPSLPQNLNHSYKI